MEMHFTPRESSVLYGLLAETTTDIIVKTDRDGFIRHASAAIERLGFALPGMLILPHILDLVHPSFTQTIRSAYEAVVKRRHVGDWIEFAAVTSDGCEQWFEIQMQSLVDEHARVYGALGVMRSIDERRSLEQKLFVAQMTDSLTGLTNRRAFTSMLEHLVERQANGCLALFDIDHFKAINLQHGQSVGDEVLVVFADFLRTMMRSDDIISRVGGESFGVLLPHTEPDRAAALCQRIVDTLAEISQSVCPEGVAVTASVGITRIGGTLDMTIRRAELAVFLAKAKGRCSLELDQNSRLALS